MGEATAERMSAIGKQHGLLIDKIGIMAEETGYVMLGLEHPNDFIKNLAETLGIADEKAQAIAKDINEQVFRPIRDHLIDIHKLEKVEQKPSFSQKAPPPGILFVNAEKIDQGPPPSYRPPSFAMPIEKNSEKIIPPAPKFETEQQKPPAQTQEAPTLQTKPIQQTVVVKPKTQSLGQDPYREPIG
ncbi:MAG: hypothetical protein A3G60_00305 [Candidatus Ryanbacteria bacterium RIFCSPLOWO2_12_FULL_47_9c]|nr:MAG: hypothetical protein A3G60_00305 [Candidatus Ryanbacteria bacterium RIFCSPLOWO2_12_FULL_47_9c]